jgi:hypothetical protein
MKIFIGYDSKEPIAFHVLAHSLLRRASRPITIVPLTMEFARACGYARERGPTESTEFSMTRFMVPAMCGFRDMALFMDCDMLCLDDIWKLPTLLDSAFDCNGALVCCCKHDYEPKPGAKVLGNQQTSYPRKNWSSLMAFDCARCAALTPDYVNRATGLELHRMLWAEEKIGSIPLEWNWLVGEYNIPTDRVPNVLHYTLGGPWFKEYEACDAAGLWRDEFDHMTGKYAHG